MATSIIRILAVVYNSFLGVCAKVLMYLSTKVGNSYTFIWPHLHQSCFDHRFDYLRGIDNYPWYERVILALHRIKSGGVVLDIGCGDGIYSGLFYSQIAKRIDAIDIDPWAIEYAKNNYSKKNVNFKNVSIFEWLKSNKKYDTIFMFVVIEHFTVEEGRKVLKGIGGSLNKGGIFYGSTALFAEKGGHNFEHKNEFFSEKKLKKFIGEFFNKVELHTSVWPNGRRECYFKCSSPKK